MISHQLVEQLVVFLRIPSISWDRLKISSTKREDAIHRYVWTRSMGFGIIYLPTPSKDCQIKPKGWLIDTP